MTIGVASILFTGVQTFTNTAGGTRPEGFSIITTEFIPAGEVIRFTNSDAVTGGTNVGYFEYTVGTGGLPALTVVAFSVNLQGTDTPSIEVDPSNGSVSANVIGSDFSIAADSEIVASSGGEVIAGIGWGSDNWNTNVGATGLSTTNIDAYILAGTTPEAVVNLGNSGADNYLYSGTTLEGISNPANWVNSGGTATDHDNPNISGITYASQEANITCFLAGTLIATPKGEQPVERLQIGDLVATEDGRAVPVLWIGRQLIHKHRRGERSQPVRIAQDALGPNTPHTDLYVTADHGMILDGFVINASVLVNHATIDFVPMDELSDSFFVYHIETERHDVIHANGAPSETFVDAVTRSHFDNFQEYLDIYGTERIIPELSRPRISSARLMPASIKERLHGWDMQRYASLGG